MRLSVPSSKALSPTSCFARTVNACVPTLGDVSLNVFMTITDSDPPNDTCFPIPLADEALSKIWTDRVSEPEPAVPYTSV